jgi:hypothetical protein
VDGDVTRGAWLKIGDAPKVPGCLSRPQTCPFALGSVRHCVLLKGEKAVKLSITGVSPARRVLAIAERFDTEATVCRLGPWQREDGALPRTIHQYK